ncbi:SDR family NAD(P)-dependent oxidoreductase [Neptunomonas sp.]|uniref:SDR family NAD(P)-dependent oxidoreductase n=1 Tax=Neptunomonas sp. TaxID=1971898 RepID=UPI0035681975
MGLLNNQDASLKVAVIGATGGIGQALIQQLTNMPGIGYIYAYSRTCPDALSAIENLSYSPLDYANEQSIADAAAALGKTRLDVVIVATGVLHGENFTPEKSIRSLEPESFEEVFQLNTLGPMLVAKHFLPYMNKNNKTAFTALSARVGSISDNRLGGWYSYRASKAALNMMLKGLAIECRVRYPDLIVAGLHPGTVNTSLSEPFQKNVPSDKLFSAEQSASYLLKVIDNLDKQDSGKVFAWDGKEIPA